MPLRERLIDFTVPERSFKKPITREIRACLRYIDETYSNNVFSNNPRMIKGIGVTIGKFGREGRVGKLVDFAQNDPRGYFWEMDEVRHVVGQEVMTRKQEKALIEAIHGITIPYKQSEYWERSDEELFGKKS